MNESPLTSDQSFANASHEEVMSALFAHMIMQQTNMTLMLLGKVAHPVTGEFVRDTEGAKMFIDQLEMLEFKTKGNLTKEEDGLLKQSLMALRMGFVEAVESPQAQKQPHAAPPAPAPAAEPAPMVAPGKSVESPVTLSPAGGEESRKKFSKKY